MRSARLAWTPMSCVISTNVLPSLSLNILEQLDHAALHHHIKRRGRLVGEDQLRREDRRQRYRHALAHPAGKLVGIRAEHFLRKAQVAQIVPRHFERSLRLTWRDAPR